MMYSLAYFVGSPEVITNYVSYNEAVCELIFPIKYDKTSKFRILA